MNNIAIQTNSLAAWMRATRPRTLGAMACPVFLGSALAFKDSSFSWSLFMTTFICAMLLQILANLVNDYGDFLRGSDTKERLGPPRAMQMGWLTAPAMKKGIALVILSIVILGLILTARAGISIFFVGSASLITCVWYTAGPRPLSYLGFSEIAVLLLFGPLPVLGSYFVQGLSLPKEGIILSIAPALLSTALILTNNLRDIDEDRRHRKMTLAVRFGAPMSRMMIVGCVCLASLSPLLLLFHFHYSPLVLVSLLGLIFPIRQFKMILYDSISAKFNLMLQAVGKSLYVVGVLLSIGIIYGAP